MSLKGKLSALRFGRGSGQHIFMGAGVIVAAVVLVSFLTWLNDAHKPIARSIEEAVGSSLPGVLEQVEGRVAQAATLLGVEEESIQNVREGLAAARSGITGSWAPALASLPGVGTATTTTPSPERSSSSSPTTDDSPPSQAASEPSAPSSSGGTGETSPAPPPATEAPSPATTEPTTEEPAPPPAAEEPPPAAEEPPPAAEEPPSTEEPAPPTAEEPPPTTD